MCLYSFLAYNFVAQVVAQGLVMKRLRGDDIKVGHDGHDGHFERKKKLTRLHFCDREVKLCHTRVKEGGEGEVSEIVIISFR